MTTCSHNPKKTVTVRFFRSDEVEEYDGECVYSEWTQPKFRASEWKKVGKKMIELGHTYQERYCKFCKIVQERIVR